MAGAQTPPLRALCHNWAVLTTVPCFFPPEHLPRLKVPCLLLDLLSASSVRMDDSQEQERCLVQCFVPRGPHPESIHDACECLVRGCCINEQGFSEPSLLWDSRNLWRVCTKLFEDCHWHLILISAALLERRVEAGSCKCERPVSPQRRGRWGSEQCGTQRRGFSCCSPGRLSYPVKPSPCSSLSLSILAPPTSTDPHAVSLLLI